MARTKSFNVDAVFRAIDRFSAPVVKMEKGMKRFTRGLERRLRKASASASKFFKVMRRGARNLAIVGAVAGAVGADIIRTGAQFEQSLTAAVAKFPEGIKKGTAAFNELSAVAQKIGGETEFTASQSAEGLNFLAMAGFSAEQAMAALPGVVNLATAAQTELGTASDFATDTLGAFNLMVEDSTQLQENLARVSDVMAKTTTSANTSFEDLFEAYKKAGPVATAAGGQIEETSALLAVLANAGFKGSEGGVALRNAYLGVTAATGKAAGLVKKYVGSLDDGHGGVIGMTEVIRRLNVSMADMSKEDRIKALTRIFGKRAVGPFLTLMAQGAERVEEFTDSLKAAQGTSDSMADTMRNTVHGSLKGLQSAVESVKIGLFDMNSGPLKDTIDQMANWVRENRQLIFDKVNDFIEFFREHGPLIVNILGRIARVVGVFTVLATGVKVATAAMIALNIAMAANPIGILIVAIGALAFFWEDIVGTWREAKLILSNLWQTILDGANRISPILGKVVELIGKIMSWSPVGLAARAMDYFLGDDDDEQAQRGGAPPMPTLADGSPAFQVGGGRSEFVTREEVNLLIVDPNNRATVTRSRPKGRSNLALGRSGG